jgi:hypothetical protein
LSAPIDPSHRHSNPLARRTGQHTHQELTMNPMIIHLATHEHTRELHRVQNHARRHHPAIRPTRRITIAAPRPFGRRTPRPAAG